MLEADYSVCLQLLLKYPPPQAPHGPHTFVDDALYLKGHLHSSGGSSLILKYTGRMPAQPSSTSRSRPTTPNTQSLAVRSRALAGRSPLASPSRFIQQQGGVEAILSGAAKKVYERGENLGINQAVRDAVGEIRRNVQGFQDARLSPRAPMREGSASDGSSGARAVAAMERRNRQLGRMLDESLANLQALATLDLEDREKARELVQLAAAKIQFVRVYLEDSSMEVPSTETRPTSGAAAPGDEKQDDAVMDVAGSSEAAAASTSPSGADSAAAAISGLSIHEQKQPAGSEPHAADAMDTSGDGTPSAPKAAEADPVPVPVPVPVPQRPSAPIPTRSTLAQSSFSWMLEPDVSASSAPAATPPFAGHRSSLGPGSQPGSAHKKRGSASASREKNAFLFGEITADAEQGRAISRDDIFGLQPWKKEGSSSSRG